MLTGVLRAFIDVKVAVHALVSSHAAALIPSKQVRTRAAVFAWCGGAFVDLRLAVRPVISLLADTLVRVPDILARASVLTHILHGDSLVLSHSLARHHQHVAQAPRPARLAQTLKQTKRILVGDALSSVTAWIGEAPADGSLEAKTEKNM